MLLLSSSLGFAVLYFLTPLLNPMSPVLLAALRLALGSVALFAFFAATRSLGIISDTWRHLTAKPWRLPVALMCGVLLATQLWLFAYGPMSGRALQVSLGYFLLPLVLVLVGRFLYKDQLTWWHWLAVAVAAAGVLYETVRIGGFAWEALWVALMYPLYFVLRRAIGIAHLGGMFWEMTLLAPFALCYFLALAPGSDTFQQRPELWLLAPAIGMFGSITLVVWVLSTKYLPMSLFGLLSYLEPGMLMGVSLLLGESLGLAELPLYLAVWAAVVTIVVGGSVSALRQRRALRQGTAAGAEAAAATPAEDQMLLVAATGSIPIIDVATVREAAEHDESLQQRP